MPRNWDWRMDPADRIERLIRPTAEAMGFDLIRVQILGQQRFRLQIMAERLVDGSMTIDDCAELSRAISPILEVEDPLATAYTLEVSSPGIDRPLVRLEDFEKYAGFEARIELKHAVGNRRRFQGKLMGTDARNVRLSVGDEEVTLAFDDVRRAKLMLTTELLEAHERNAAVQSGRQ